MARSSGCSPSEVLLPAVLERRVAVNLEEDLYPELNLNRDTIVSLLCLHVTLSYFSRSSNTHFYNEDLRVFLALT